MTDVCDVHNQRLEDLCDPRRKGRCKVSSGRKQFRGLRKLVDSLHACSQTGGPRNRCFRLLGGSDNGTIARSTAGLFEAIGTLWVAIFFSNIAFVKRT